MRRPSQPGQPLSTTHHRQYTYLTGRGAASAASSIETRRRRERGWPRQGHRTSCTKHRGVAATGATRLLLVIAPVVGRARSPCDRSRASPPVPSVRWPDALNLTRPLILLGPCEREKSTHGELQEDRGGILHPSAFVMPIRAHRLTASCEFVYRATQKGAEGSAGPDPCVCYSLWHRTGFPVACERTAAHPLVNWEKARANSMSAMPSNHCQLPLCLPIFLTTKNSR